MTPVSPFKQIIGLLGWLTACAAAASLGALASANAGGFYLLLNRPQWAPPAWLFAPVWSVLYCLMGVAAWLVWRAAGWRAHRGALLLFIGQLLANALWTWLFFVWHQGALAFAEISVLWVLILCTLIAFWRVRRVAGVLLMPYLLWVSFAAVLAGDLWWRNPGLLG